jgi:hypothetical protein
MLTQIRDDAHRSQSAIDKLVDHARKHGTKLQYAAALATQLPSSPVYSYLEGRLPQPAHTYVRIVEIHEALEAATIKRLIDERRLRLGATLDTTTSSVKNEVYGSSPLDSTRTLSIGRATTTCGGSTKRSCCSDAMTR